MQPQTGIAKTCQCCLNAPARNKLRLDEEINETTWYRYMCDPCTSFVKSLELGQYHISVHPYIGIPPEPEDDDPLDEAREMIDNLM